MWPPEPYDDLDLLRMRATALLSLRRKFERGDSLALLEVVSETSRVMFTLPWWAHRALAAGCDSFIRREQSLDAALGVAAGPGRGNDPFSRRYRSDFAAKVLFHTECLNRFLGFNLAVSFLILHKGGVEDTALNRVFLSPDRLEEIYKTARKEHARFDFGAWADEEPFDYFWDQYSQPFTELFEARIFHEAGLEKSARRSLNRLTENALKRNPPLPPL
ncbi:MAG: hypothetical protein JXR59_06160 [Desulfuromonadaceae bacterium]|nr:hypothetical protein [Desulfuromonadaceae bacterium]